MNERGQRITWDINHASHIRMCLGVEASTRLRSSFSS